MGVDGAGNLVVADTMSDRVRVVAASTGSFYGIAMTAGDIYTVAGDGLFRVSGDGGPATTAELAGPVAVAVAVDHGGNLVIADELNNRVRVVAAHTGTFYAIAMTAGASTPSPVTAPPRFLVTVARRPKPAWTRRSALRPTPRATW